jgi:ACS family hexuronate transporter-like MFS transporter
MDTTHAMGPPGPWWRQKRWWVAIMLCAVTMIGYVDRLALSVAAPVLKQEFSFTNEEYGRITLAFLLTYAAGQLLLGPLVGRIGSKRSLSLAVVWWSIASILHAFGKGVWSFFAARAFLGISESVNFPAAFRVVAEWFPRAERSLAAGFITAGTGFGAILAPVVIAPLITWFDALHAAGLSPINGWHAAFILPGALGFVWVWLWNRHFHLPEDHPGIPLEERRMILADRAAAPEAGGGVRPGVLAELGAYFRGLGVHFRHRETWGLLLARFSGDGAFYFFAFWIPLYLRDERGFTMMQIAWGAALPFLFADAGSFFGGWAGQRLIRGGLSVNASRKLMIWAGALLVPLALPAVYVESALAAVIFMGLGVFAIQVKSASLFAVPADLFPPRDVATVWGISGAAGSVAAALSQPLIGLVIDRTGSYEPVFIMVSSLHIVSAVFVTLLIPRIDRVARAGG